MKFKFNAQTRKIDLMEDYSALISDETLKQMSPDNDLPYINKDQFTEDILNKLDPNRDLKAFQRIAQLAKTKNSRLMLLNFLLGKAENALSTEAKDYLLIALQSVPEDTMTKA